MTPKEFIKDFKIEISLRAKNNYGDWYDEDKEIKESQARERIRTAIEEILEEEKKAFEEKLYSLLESGNLPEMNELLADMME